MIVGILVLLLISAAPVYGAGSPAPARPLAHPGAGPPSAGRPGPAVAPRPGPIGPIPYGSPTYTGHYYAGAEYAGASTSASDISVDILVPQDTPQARDFYYVIVSAWDNAQSYDQIGLSSSNGVWGVTYSTTTPCAQNYLYKANAFPLTPGTEYHFDMQMTSVSSGGYDLDFSVSYIAGGVVWSYQTSTGGSSFVVDNMYTCGGGSYYGYTDYEEVYNTTGPAPPYTFFFTNNTENGNSETQWGGFVSSGAPAGIRVGTGGSEVVVENEPFGLSAPFVLISEIGPAARNYSDTVTVSKYLSDGTLAVSEAGAVPNATVSVAPLSGAAPFEFNVTVRVGPTTVPGSGYPIEIEVTDSGGSYARLEIVAQVNAALEATLPAPAHPGTDVNRSMTISESPVGGSGVYTYRWTGLPPGCPNATASVTCTPTGTGSYSVAVQVVDSLGFSSNSSAYHLVVAPILTLLVTSNVSTLDIGQSVEFGAAPMGGSGGLAFVWSYGTLASCAPTGSNLTCIPNSAGTLAVTLAATDLAQARVTATGTADVSTDPTVTLSASRTSAEVGHAIVLTAVASGGLPIPSGASGGFGYTLSWTGLPSSCSAAGPASERCIWSSPGPATVSAVVTDANHEPSPPAPLKLTVASLLAVAIDQSAYSTLEGQTVLLEANVSGGVGPFHFTWSGLPAGCSTGTGMNLTCQFQSSGTFAISVEVVDALGVNATATGAISIQTAFLGLPATEGYAVVGGVVAALAAAVGAGLLLRRRRRRGPPPVADEPSE